jgi:hypothetical protein
VSPQEKEKKKKKRRRFKGNSLAPYKDPQKVMVAV